MVLLAPAVGKPCLEYGLLHAPGKRVNCSTHHGRIFSHRLPMNQLIVITAVAPDRCGIVRKLTGLVRKSGAEVIESRMVALGSEFAIHALVAGNWHVLSRLEKQLAGNCEDADITISVRRSEPVEVRSDVLPYNIDAVTLRQTDVLASFVEFFIDRGIEIVEITTTTYKPQRTETAVASVQMTVNVPGSLQIAVLRNEFVDFCDHLNVDANLEPALN